MIDSTACGAEAGTPARPSGLSDARLTTWLEPNAACSSRRISASLGAPGATPSEAFATGPLTAATFGAGACAWTFAIGLVIARALTVGGGRYGAAAVQAWILSPPAPQPASSAAPNS